MVLFLGSLKNVSKNFCPKSGIMTWWIRTAHWALAVWTVMFCEHCNNSVHCNSIVYYYLLWRWTWNLNHKEHKFIIGVQYKFVRCSIRWYALYVLVLFRWITYPIYSSRNAKTVCCLLANFISLYTSNDLLEIKILLKLQLLICLFELLGMHTSMLIVHSTMYWILSCSSHNIWMAGHQRLLFK